MEKEQPKKPKPFRIGEVSKLYDVPVPTLRFWEQEGFLHAIRNEDNNYRVFDPSDTLIDLGDAIFYRSIGIPFKEVKRIKNMNSADLQKTFCGAKETMLSEIEAIKKKIGVIEQRLAIINKLQNATSDLVEEEIPFERVIAFDYNNKDHYRRYLDDPNCFISVNTTDMPMQYDINGLSVEQDYPGEEIFVKSPEAKYLASYIKGKTSEFYYQFEEQKSKLKSEYGISSTQYILQFMINMVDENGDRCDYYKVWFKLR